jgi:hypothetical protein
MTKVTVQNVKNKITKEVSKNLVSDYVSTKEWKVYEKSKFTISHKKEEIKPELPKIEE